MRAAIGISLLLLAVGCQKSTNDSDSTKTQAPTNKLDSTEIRAAESGTVMLQAPFSKKEAEAARESLAAAKGIDAELTNSIGMKLNLIPAGEFEMGGGGDDYEMPVHKVRISNAFYLGATVVTQSQWQAVMKTTPWREDGKDQEYAKSNGEHAASYISWDDAVEFCKKLSAKEGETYRLPTEAEWEYACRAGSKTEYSFGDDESSLGDYAWYNKNAWDVDEKYAHAVGQKKPNEFGLFDMHGNVWEWCQDKYDEDYYKNSPLVDPVNLQTGSSRVLRGGSWTYYAVLCRSAYRGGLSPSDRNPDIGFRVVCE